MCRDCKFYDNRECKLNPPQVVYDAEDDDLKSLWPMVEPIDWCGQYEVNDGMGTQSQRGLR
jgi:hypothetical protein